MAVTEDLPWHAKPLRLAQINLNELDPQRLDVEAWIDYLAQAKVDVLSFNVGGAVAFYPSELHGHNITPFLGGRDPVDELTTAARSKGMKVLARLDFNRTKDVLYHEHPDWFTIDYTGKPIMHYGFYDACPSGPYYSEFMPSVIREIMARYRFDGIFAVNCHYTSFTIAVCHCAHCRRLFREAEGQPLPAHPDWDNPVWHRYMRWRYRMTTEVWNLLKNVTREADPQAVFLGNLGGGISRNTPHGWELSEIAHLEDAVQQETQNRGAGEPVFLPAEQGKLMRSVAHGKQVWLMMSYNFGFGARFQASPPAELQVWFAEAFAAGGLPYVHFIGGRLQDTRSLDTIRDLLVWHAANERHLGGDSLAETAVVYSLRTVDHYGKDRSPQRYDSHFRGYYQALLRSHIPFDVLHEAALAQTDLSRYKVLVLPNAACLPEEAIESIRGFVRSGGGLVATHETTLFDEWGKPRDDFALSDLFGAHYNGRTVTDLFHSHMRIKGSHPVTAGLEGTEMLPNAGAACSVHLDGDAAAPLVLVPPCPTYPPELAWTRIEETSQAMAVAHEAGGRVVYFPGTPDRLYWENNLPDHAAILANAVRWAGSPVEIGLPEWESVDVHLYRIDGAVVLHLVNLTGAERGPLYKLNPLYDVPVCLKLPADIHAVEVRALVDAGTLPLERDGDTVKLVIPALRHYEVLVFEHKA
ncbi:beta-galactosidase trimerization domain-containing protein [Paenibacillus thalictri]|uniref:beta-galactosidase trimerization domain-containing protein n=1 Tax=Paenibacillus thalictri TaxID=2527873 RepID=UPI0013EF0086|nr:beta-galactosidase trimerization domain-containing protein [Paenibacillus thalictri]